MQNLSKEMLLYIPSSINSLGYIHHSLKIQSNYFGFLVNIRKCQKFSQFLSSHPSSFFYFMNEAWEASTL